MASAAHEPLEHESSPTRSDNPEGQAMTSAEWEAANEDDSDRWACYPAQTGLYAPNNDRTVWRDRGVRIAALEAENAELRTEVERLRDAELRVAIAGHAATTGDPNCAGLCGNGKDPSACPSGCTEDAPVLSGVTWASGGMGKGEPSIVRHNHMTRDIKRSGQCPACDLHHTYGPVVVTPRAEVAE